MHTPCRSPTSWNTQDASPGTSTTDPHLIRLSCQHTDSRQLLFGFKKGNHFRTVEELKKDSVRHSGHHLNIILCKRKSQHNPLQTKEPTPSFANERWRHARPTPSFANQRGRNESTDGSLHSAARRSHSIHAAASSSFEIVKMVRSGELSDCSGTPVGPSPSMEAENDCGLFALREAEMCAVSSTRAHRSATSMHTTIRATSFMLVTSDRNSWLKME